MRLVINKFRKERSVYDKIFYNFENEFRNYNKMYVNIINKNYAKKKYKDEVNFNYEKFKEYANNEDLKFNTKLKFFFNNNIKLIGTDNNYLDTYTYHSSMVNNNINNNIEMKDTIIDDEYDNYIIKNKIKDDNDVKNIVTAIKNEFEINNLKELDTLDMKLNEENILFKSKINQLLKRNKVNSKYNYNIKVINKISDKNNDSLKEYIKNINNKKSKLIDYINNVKLQINEVNAKSKCYIINKPTIKSKLYLLFSINKEFNDKLKILINSINYYLEIYNYKSTIKSKHKNKIKLDKLLGNNYYFTKDKYLSKEINLNEYDPISKNIDRLKNCILSNINKYNSNFN